MMQIDKKGINLIKSVEGCRLKAYKVHKNEKYYTIGYGHYGADVREGQTITSKQATELLEKDLARFEKAVSSAVVVPITQSMFNALVSFTYNVGAGAFKSSSLLKYLNKKEYTKASNEFSKWTKCGDVVLAGLVKRRAKEKKEFLRLGMPTAKKPATKKPSEKMPSLKGYKGFSLVDGLKQFGYKSDFDYRASLWKLAGKKDKYKGTGEQNAKLLNILKSR